jgi:hypothetical protein
MFIWYLLLCLVIGGSLALAAFVLPKIYLSTRYTITQPTDRGIKKILEKSGQSMLFEPALKYRKYLKQYVLAERYGKKELICKLDENVSYIHYDIVLFNNRDEVFQVLTVKELIEKQGYTKVVDLPDETSYVSLAINEVDGKTFPDNLTKKIKKGKLKNFLLVSSLLIIMEVFCIKVCLGNIFGGVFREIFILSERSGYLTLLIIGVLILINCLVVGIAMRIRSGKKVGRKK